MEEFFRLMTFGMSPQMRQAVLNVGWRVLVSVHIALACGWLSVSGFPGFARADAVTALRQAQLDAAAEVVAQNIFDTRVRQCNATTADARVFYAERLQALTGRYYSLTQRVYAPMPACGEL